VPRKKKCKRMHCRYRVDRNPVEQLVLVSVGSPIERIRVECRRHPRFIMYLHRTGPVREYVKALCYPRTFGTVLK